MTAVLHEDISKSQKDEKGPEMLSVNFAITPLKAKGKQLACAITGSAVNGGIIELDSASSHTMHFELQDGEVPGLTFVADDEGPFCSIADGCPKKGDQVPQFKGSVVTNSGRTLTVTADPGTEPIVHYALNFSDGKKTLSWDPIVINN